MASDAPAAVRIERATGAEIARYFDALAALRIGVFRDYPYLYDGSLAYERDYLASYIGSPASLAVVACDGDRVVGASTALPLTDDGVIAQGTYCAPGWVVADVDLDAITRVRADGQVLGHRDWDLPGHLAAPVARARLT